MTSYLGFKLIESGFMMILLLAGIFILAFLVIGFELALKVKDWLNEDEDMFL